MKACILSFIGVVLCPAVALAASPVVENRSWTVNYPVSTASPRLEVSNIWGGVRVRAGEAGRVTVAITETRSAPDQRLFDRSLDMIRLDIAADASGVSLLVGNGKDLWQRWDDCHDCRVDYQFDIQVPPDTVVDVGTVMDGKVDIQGVAGVVRASNVNGSIHVVDVRDCASVDNVNGPITIGFSQSPQQDCRIETVNGDVTLDMPGDASLDMALDLFNGKVSSELPVGPFAVPASVEQIVEDGRTRYRIQQQAGIRIGAGGPTYSVASVNGDVRITKHQ
jgi:hypothetical protein